MSLALKTILISEERDLETLKGKTLSIDIMPFLYKYLYSYSKNGQVLQNSKNVITSHLKGFLSLIKNLKTYNITAVICIDGKTSSIKIPERNRRRDTRLKHLEKYQLLEDKGLILDQIQLNKKKNYYYTISLNEVKTIVECCRYLGILVFQINYIEGQRSCVALKQEGLVDECLTPDRDAILYAADFYTDIDFKTKKITYYSFKNNLDQLFLKNQQELIDCAIASGCDYTKGIPNIGPKKALKMLREEPEKIKTLIKEHVYNYQEIVDTIYGKVPFSSLQNPKKDPLNFSLFLKSLDFDQKQIINLCSHLF